MTNKDFQIAVQTAKKLKLNHQLHLANPEESWESEGVVYLAYDPFPNNWRLSKTVVLAKVNRAYIDRVVMLDSLENLLFSDNPTDRELGEMIAKSNYIDIPLFRSANKNNGDSNR